MSIDDLLAVSKTRSGVGEMKSRMDILLSTRWSYMCGWIASLASAELIF